VVININFRIKSSFPHSIKLHYVEEGVVQPSKTSINSYNLGLRMKTLKTIQLSNKRNTRERGVKPGIIREKMFEVRELESDRS